MPTKHLKVSCLIVFFLTLSFATADSMPPRRVASGDALPPTPTTATATTGLDPRITAILKVAKVTAAQLDQVAPPGVDKTTCGGLWAVTGFVCDKEKLKPEVTGIALARDQTLLEFKNALANLRQISLLGPNSRTFKPSQLSLIRSFTSTGSQTKQNTAASRCWNLLVNLKSSSYCFVCSALNYEYFLKDSIIIKRDTCVQILTECAEHLGALSSILKFAGLQPKTAQLKTFANAKFFEDWLTDLVDVEKRLPAMPPVQADGTVTSVDSAMTCSKLFVIGKERDYFGQVIRFLDFSSTLILAAVQGKLFPQSWKWVTRIDGRPPVSSDDNTSWGIQFPDAQQLFTNTADSRDVPTISAVTVAEHKGYHKPMNCSVMWM